MLHQKYSTSLKMRRSTHYIFYILHFLLGAGQALEANPKLICLEGVERFSVGESVHHYYDCEGVLKSRNKNQPTGFIRFHWGTEADGVS